MIKHLCDYCGLEVPKAGGWRTTIVTGLTDPYDVEVCSARCAAGIELLHPARIAAVRT